MTSSTDRASVFIWGNIGELLKEIDEGRRLTLGLEDPGRVLFRISQKEHLDALRKAKTRIWNARKLKHKKDKKRAIREAVEEFKEAIRGTRYKDAIFLAYSEELHNLDAVSRGSALLGELTPDEGTYGVDEVEEE